MLSLFTRRPKVPVEAEPVAPDHDIPGHDIEAEGSEPVRRMKQQNIKASEDCCAAFAAIAEALGISKAALFEDMVAERLEALRRQGVELELA
jgi:hypothetical protein